MSIPTWEQFSALFENPNSGKVRRAKASLFARYPTELKGYRTDEDYLTTFRTVFEILQEGRWGIFSLLETLVERLSSHVLQVQFEDDDESATVRFEGREARFYCTGLHYETFEADMATLQNLMQDSYVFRVFYEGGIGDAWEFLVVPADMWARAEKRYGSARLSACLKSFDDPMWVDESYDATLRWRAPRGRFFATRLGMPVLLAACIGAAIPALNLYNSLTRTKANSPPTCESLNKVYGKLKAEQAKALVEDMRRRGACR